MQTCKFTKKLFHTHPHSCIFPSFPQNASRSHLPKEALKLCEHHLFLVILVTNVFWLKSCNLYMKQAVCRRYSRKKVLWKRDIHPQAYIRRCSVKKMFLKISQNSQKINFAGVSFLIKLEVRNLKLSETATVGVLLKRCSSQFLKYHRKTPVLESLFNKVPGLACNFIEKRLPHRCFPMKFEKFLRANILKNICERLLLSVIKKETLTQVFSCELCEYFKDTSLVDHLRMAVSKTPVQGSLFNKVASLTAWSPVTLENFAKLFARLFCRTPPSNTCYMMLFFSTFWRLVRSAA